MNGKAAKLLRRLAKEMTVGHQPEVSYRNPLSASRGDFVHIPNPETGVLTPRYRNGKRVELGKCTRSVYKRLKKVFLEEQPSFPSKL